MKLLVAVLVLVTPLTALGQAPTSLEVFTSPDGTFQFLYPDNYQLLIGERLLRATQTRPQSIPPCDFSTALVCVIYPLEGPEDTRFEGAGFSVDAVPGAASESQCLASADQPAARADKVQPSLIRVNGHLFLYSPTKKMRAGHLQSGYSYRTYQKEHCYELRIEISLSDSPKAPPPPKSNSLGDPKADSARESLKLILGSFYFRD